MKQLSLIIQTSAGWISESMRKMAERTEKDEGESKKEN